MSTLSEFLKKSDSSSESRPDRLEALEKLRRDRADLEKVRQDLVAAIQHELATARVDLKRMTITLESGAEHKVNSELALRYALVLISAAGEPLKRQRIYQIEPALKGRQLRDVRRRLPKVVQNRIKTGRTGHYWADAP